MHLNFYISNTHRTTSLSRSRRGKTEPRNFAHGHYVFSDHHICWETELRVFRTVDQGLERPGVQGVRGRAQVAWQLQDIPSERAKTALPMLIRGYVTKETSRTQIEQEMAQIQRRIRRSYLHCEYDDALGYAEMLNKMSNEYFGIKHPVYAASLNNLGLLNKSLGRFDIAIDFYSQAVDARIKRRSATSMHQPLLRYTTWELRSKIWQSQVIILSLKNLTCTQKQRKS